MKQKLQPIINPRCVAVAGASEAPGFGESVFKNLIQFGFHGKVFPVNPKYRTVFGHRCFASVIDVPEEVDCFLLAIPGPHVFQALQEASEKNVKAVVVLTSGFAEAGEDGRLLQDKMKQFSRETGIRIHGPNCLGILNMRNRVALYSGPLPEPDIVGRLGVVTQSGALSVTLMWALLQRRIGFRYLISSGNEVDLEVADYIEFMLEDPEVDAIVCFVEGLKDGAKFLRATDLAIQRKKPIVVLKTGRSEKGRKATLAHTGALAGNDAVYDAVFRQKGVIRVCDLNELIETAELFSKAKPPRGDGMGILTISGGETSLLSDIASDLKLKLPDLSNETKQRLSEVLPRFLTVANPLDNAGGGAGAAAIIHARDTTGYAKSLEIFLQDENLHVVVVSQDAFNRQGATGLLKTQLSLDVASSIAGASRKTDKPLVFLSSTYGGLSEELYEVAKVSNIPVLQGAREGLAAVGHLIRFGQFVRGHRKVPALGFQFKVGSEAFQAVRSSRNKTLTSSESMKLLSDYGVPVAKYQVATSAANALEIARAIGYPVALKAEAPEIVHKTEAGALKLGINTDDDLVRCYGEVIGNARASCPECEIRGVLVQEMVSGGTEIILGVSTDPQFGHVLLLGLGGIFVELFRDFSLRLPPIDENTSKAMLKELRANEVLFGFRGKPRLDVEALVNVIVTLSSISADLGDDLREIEINPLMVFEEGKGVKGVDALVVSK